MTLYSVILNQAVQIVDTWQHPVVRSGRTIWFLRLRFDIPRCSAYVSVEISTQSTKIILDQYNDNAIQIGTGVVVTEWHPCKYWAIVGPFTTCSLRICSHDLVKKFLCGSHTCRGLLFAGAICTVVNVPHDEMHTGVRTIVALMPLRSKRVGCVHRSCEYLNSVMSGFKSVVGSTKLPRGGRRRGVQILRFSVPIFSAQYL